MGNFFIKTYYLIKQVVFRISKLINYFYYKRELGMMLIVFIPSILLAILFGFIVLDDFTQSSKDTTYLTNYGFAILIGISSICFSWARNMDKESEPLMLNKVSTSGENSFHCAIMFLISSAIKYSLVNLNFYIPKEWFYIYNILHTFLYCIFLLCFTIAYVKFEGVIRELNFLLYERLNLKEKY